MEIIIYHLLCLLARKKFFLNILYFTGTILFISLSYNTAHKLYKVPVGFQRSASGSSANISQISNDSSQYENRMQFLRNKCVGNSNPSRHTLSKLNYRNEILNHLGFILRSHSLFYCSVPKVATRTLLTFITYLHIRDELITSFTDNSTSYFHVNSNLVNMDYLNKMLSSSIKDDRHLLLSMFLSRLITTVNANSTQLDLWTMYQNKALPYIRLRSLSDHSILFSSSFTRVIFVRHPLERLASAYADKIASLKAEPLSLYDSLRRKICQRFSSSYLTIAEQQAYRINRFLAKQIDEPCEKIIPTFEHFVDYIMSDSLQLDVHWQPYSTLCDVCKFKYNFIGKYETMQEDLNFLKSQLGLDSTEWNINNHFSTGKTKENYKLMYSKLPKHLICNLKNFYNEDFKLFDYQFEDYLIDHQKVDCPHQYYRRF